MTADEPAAAPRARLWPGPGRRAAGASVLCALALGLTAHAVGPPAGAADETAAELARGVIEALLEDRYHDAYDRALEAAAAAPSSGRVWALLGLAEVKSGRYRSGEASLRRSVQLESESPEGHLGLGLLAFGRNDLKAAARHFQIATRSRRLFNEAFYALRATRLDEGDLVGARRVLRDHEARLGAEGRALPPRLVAGRKHLELCAAERVSEIAPDFERTAVELAVRRGAGSAWRVRVRLNGRGWRELHLDTAYRGLLAISPRLARELDLETAGSFETRGVGPAAPETRGTWLDTVQAGELTIRTVPALVIDSASYRGESSGLIGTGLLKKFNVVIDPRGEVLELFARDRQELFRRRLARARVAERLPFLVYNAPVVHVRLDGGEKAPFTLDTGASASLVDVDYFNAHLRPHIPEGALADASVRGAGGIERTRAWTDATVRIGTLRFRHMRLILFDMHRLNRLSQRYTAGVLTGTVLWRYRSYFDFDRSELTLEEYPAP